MYNVKMMNDKLQVMPIMVQSLFERQGGRAKIAKRPLHVVVWSAMSVLQNLFISDA